MAVTPSRFASPFFGESYRAVALRAVILYQHIGHEPLNQPFVDGLEKLGANRLHAKLCQQPRSYPGVAGSRVGEEIASSAPLRTMNDNLDLGDTHSYLALNGLKKNLGT